MRVRRQVRGLERVRLRQERDAARRDLVVSLQLDVTDQSLLTERQREARARWGVSACSLRRVR